MLRNGIVAVTPSLELPPEFMFSNFKGIANDGPYF